MLWILQYSHYLITCTSNACTSKLASFPGPAQLSIACSSFACGESLETRLQPSGINGGGSAARDQLIGGKLETNSILHPVVKMSFAITELNLGGALVPNCMWFVYGQDRNVLNYNSTRLVPITLHVSISCTLSSNWVMNKWVRCFSLGQFATCCSPCWLEILQTGL